jgi:HSP20 family molecular chaperone IbpA
MPKESRGFFERLTGARVMDPEATEEVEYEDNQAQEIEINDEDEQELENALEEADSDMEDEYSDEDTGEHKEGEPEEQEGQLTVDVFQDDSNVVIQSTIAGVAPEDLDVSITNDMVTIRGERRQGFDAEEEDYFYQECYWGTFSRSIILPVEIDADRAEAKIKNGILTIRIPKANAAMTRKLKVKAT